MLRNEIGDENNEEQRHREDGISDRTKIQISRRLQLFIDLELDFIDNDRAFLVVWFRMGL